jgi:hypothetical protein
MAKKVKSLSQIEQDEMSALLKKGRTRYENALFEIEQVWGKLKQHDYQKRAKLIKAALGMTEIDQKLKIWENKVAEK